MIASDDNGSMCMNQIRVQMRLLTLQRLTLLALKMRETISRAIEAMVFVALVRCII